MTSHDSPPGRPVDATESVVREQFESAVAGLHLDVAALVGGGMAAGRRLRRRRHVHQVGVAVAGLAVIAAAGLVGLHGNLFDSNATSPADHGNVNELVPSTPRGLAADVIADLPLGSHVMGVGGLQLGAKAIEADIHVALGSSSFEVVAAATTPGLIPTSCQALGPSDCQSRVLADGDQLITMFPQGRPVGGRPGDLLVILSGHGAVVIVGELAKPTMSGSGLPLSAAQLTAIAEDPLVGMDTTTEMLAAGQALTGFTRSADLLGVSSSSGAGSSTSSGSSSSSSGSGSPSGGGLPRRTASSSAPSPIHR